MQTEQRRLKMNWNQKNVVKTLALLKEQNKALEERVKKLEKAKKGGK